MNEKFEIGDIVKPVSNFESNYFIVGEHRHLKGLPKQLITFRIKKIKMPGQYIINESDAIRVLGRKTAELFDSDKELLTYLKLYDYENRNKNTL